jgi:allophanate hydrolase
MALNHQLTSRGARLVETTKTSSDYRLFALPGTVPEKPGLMRTGRGTKIEVEVWELSQSAFGNFVEETPAPLGIGNIQLENEMWVKGFICEPYAFEGAVDISQFGGFRAYLEAQKG